MVYMAISLALISVVDRPWTLLTTQILFYLAAIAYFFMGTSAFLLPAFGTRGWFVWAQLVFDTAMVTALVYLTGSTSSPFFVLYFMNLLSMGGLMASELRVTGASIARTVPRRLGQTYFVTQTHPGGAHHAFAVSADGERFLIPQFSGLADGFGGSIAGMYGAVNQAIGGDRNGRGTAAGGADAPITVVLDWATAAHR